MKIFICTSGTSIATNQRIDISDIQGKPLSEKDTIDVSLTLNGIKQSIQTAFSKMNVRQALDQTSAEIKSLAKLGLDRQDRVYLLVSDTLDGQICAECNRQYLKEFWNCEVILATIQGLQAHNSDLFKKKGLKNLLEKLIGLLEKYQYRNVILNITGGYKSIIPYLTLLGMIYDYPVKYIYEKSDEVITLDKIPVNYDESLILEVADKLALIDEHTEISNDAWNNDLPYEHRARYESLIEPSDAHHVTMSALGLLFYEKFKIDYPPELEKDVTPYTEKTIKLSGDHHGNEILDAFSQKLVKSPYVKAVINSLPFCPRQRDPIKQCFQDGKIELVLTHTDSGYGLAVQTTGRDLMETEKIANIIKNKYL